MKKFSVILNVVLFLAIAVLYFLHFTDGKTSAKEELKPTMDKQVLSKVKIAYVNIDTLISNYQMYIDKRDDLLLKRDESEAELQTQGRRLEREIADFQDKIQKGLITRTKAQMMQQDLGKKEQEFYQLKENLAMQLAEEEQVMNRQIINAIIEYLKIYNKEGEYHYILSNSFGGQLLYTNTALNITQDVLEGLNEDYKQNKEK